MEYFNLKTKKESLRFDTFKELNNYLVTIDTSIEKNITVKFYVNNILKVSNNYNWNGVSWEPTSVNMKTY
jgi:hypothetical protein